MKFFKRILCRLFGHKAPTIRPAYEFCRRCGIVSRYVEESMIARVVASYPRSY